MAKVGIFYGSSTGNTEYIAEKIKKHLEMDDVKIFNVDSATKEDVNQCDYLILGTSTWGVGDMQDDWEDFIDEFLKSELKGKKTALFGLGDHEVYTESFADGMGHLYDKIKDKVEITGQWPVDEYKPLESLAIRDGVFVGLPVDQDNESGSTDKKIKKWAEILKKEFK